MKQEKPTHEMTNEEFERYLKKNKLTGHAAFAASRKRRLAMNKLPETVTTSLGEGVVLDDNGDGTITLVHEGGMNEVIDKEDIHKAQYIDVGPKNFTQAMGLFRVIILDAERKGREGILPEIERMAKLCDQLPEAIAIIKRAKEQIGVGEPLYIRIDDFLKKFEA